MKWEFYLTAHPPSTPDSLGRPSIAFYSQPGQTLCGMKGVGAVYELYLLSYPLEMHPFTSTCWKTSFLLLGIVTEETEVHWKKHRQGHREQKCCFPAWHCFTVSVSFPQFLGVGEMTLHLKILGSQVYVEFWEYVTWKLNFVDTKISHYFCFIQNKIIAAVLGRWGTPLPTVQARYLRWTWCQRVHSCSWHMNERRLRKTMLRIIKLWWGWMLLLPRQEPPQPHSCSVLCLCSWHQSYPVVFPIPLALGSVRGAYTGWPKTIHEYSWRCHERTSWGTGASLAALSQLCTCTK